MPSKYSHVEVSTAKRKKALEGFRRQLAKWDLKMPRVRPLVSDFGLGDFYRIGLIEFWVANETKAGYCGKFLFVFNGQTCPYHHHQLKHETFFVLKGSVRMKVNGKNRIMKEADRLVMSTGMKHSFIGIGPALLLEVSQPSVLKDNFFANRRIGKNGLV